MSTLSRDAHGEAAPGGPGGRSLAAVLQNRGPEGELEIQAEYERQLAELRTLVASMREALEQSKVTAEADLQAVRSIYEAEIRQLKQAVAAGREALETVRQQSTEEIDRAVSAGLAETRQLREMVQSMRDASDNQS